MAGDWIPMRLDLADDPAVIAVAAAVGLDEYAVVGRLHKLWCWANTHLTDGLATAITPAWVDRFVGLPGFAAALLDAGWLQPRSAGLLFPKFDRWNSQGAKRRLRQTLTQQLRRSGDANGDGTVTPADGDTGGVKRRHAMASNRRPEERRGEKRGKNKEPPPPPAAIVPVADPPPRPRDELFDAIAAVTASDPKLSGGHIARVRKALAEADPPYTVAEVRRFGDPEFLARELSWTDGRRPTLGEVEKYIGRTRVAPLPGKPPPRSRSETATGNITGPLFYNLKPHGGEGAGEPNRGVF